MKKIVLIITFGLIASANSFAVSLPPTTNIPVCIEDQYGNQYDKLTFDVSHRLVNGIAHINQCGVDSPMIGSWDVDSSGKIILEISVSIDPSAGCIDLYKLKGTYPNSTWNYTIGFGDQPFKYKSCTSKPTALTRSSSFGGARGK